MITRPAKAIKIIALGLAFCVSQIGAQAYLPRAAATERAPEAAHPLLTGQLATTGGREVTVNGNRAVTGDTILPGAQIQTPAGVGATVYLPLLGQVEIAPQSNLALPFSAERISANLVSGCLTLRVNKGIAGEVTTPAGVTERAAAEGAVPLEVCASANGAAEAVSGGAAYQGGGQGNQGNSDRGGLWGMGTRNTVIVLGTTALITGAVIYGVTRRPPCVPRGPNPSPGVPRGRPCP